MVKLPICLLVVALTLTSTEAKRRHKGHLPIDNPAEMRSNMLEEAKKNRKASGRKLFLSVYGGSSMQKQQNRCSLSAIKAFWAMIVRSHGLSLALSHLKHIFPSISIHRDLFETRDSQ